MRAVTVILASDEFVASEELDALRGQARKEGLEIEEIAADEPQAILNALGTPSLFGNGRLVVVREAETIEEEAQEALEQFAKGQPDGVALVLVASGVTAQKLAKRFLASAVVKAEGVVPWKAAEWIVRRAAGLGRKISGDAAAALVEAIGSELRDLAGAVDRLIETTTEPIEARHVHEQFRSVESRVYQFVDAVLDRDGPLARKRLHALLEQGENSIGLIAALHRQVRVVTAVGGGSSRSPAAIAKELGLKSEGAVKRAQRQARGLSPERLARAYRLLVEADLALKSEEDDPLILELLVDELSAR